MTQNPNGYNHTSKYVPPRQFHAAELAASGNVTQTAFGWHVTDSAKHLVIVTDGLYICDCGSDSCPHTIAVTIYNTAYTYVKEFDTSVLPSFLAELKWHLLPGTDNFERLILQTLCNICDDFLNYQKVKASPIVSDPSRNQLEEELSQLFVNIYLLKAPLGARVLLPPRLKARPTDQDSAALTPYQLQLLIEGTGDPFRKVPVDAHPKTDCQVTRSELIWLYERTTDTFGQEIVDELFTFHLGCTPLDAPRLRCEEPHPTGNQMQELYEAFVDTFGEIDAHLLFADAFVGPCEE